MNINNYNISLVDGILIIVAKTKTTLDMLLEAKMLLENSTGHTYNYGMYKDGLGYYHGYDFNKNDSIYCTTLKATDAVKLVQKYINKQDEL